MIHYLYMNTTTARQVLEGLKKRRDDVIRRRRTLDAEFATLNRTIDGFTALCSPENDNPIESRANLEETLAFAESWIRHMPFAEAVRTALKVSSQPVTPTDVRDILIGANFPLFERSAPMISINVCLKRLVDSEEVELTEIDGKKRYRWIWEHSPAGFGPTNSLVNIRARQRAHQTTEAKKKETLGPLWKAQKDDEESN
jgi:hypothetical protein